MVSFPIKGAIMGITTAFDYDVKTKMSDAVADEFDRMGIDWESDDEMMQYYIDCMKRIWGERA